MSSYTVEPTTISIMYQHNSIEDQSIFFSWQLVAVAAYNLESAIEPRSKKVLVRCFKNQPTKDNRRK